MDPLSSALNIVNGINAIINTLLSKASSPEIDKLIEMHIQSRAKWEDFINRFADKFFK